MSQHKLKPIPKADELEFKEKFEERYRLLLKDRYEEFKQYSLSFLRKAIRVNTLKVTTQEMKERLSDRWELTPVPWCDHAFWIDGERRDIGNFPEHQLGYVYVQEPASMIPPLVLDPKPGETILDMCAAPGSKTTQIAQYMNNEGLLIANEMEFIRLKALAINLQRMGVHSAVITNMMGHRIKGIEFDRILVDAPCSGTGTIRKSLKTIGIWNPNMVRRLSAIQRQLADHAYSLLKPGGTLVYSTCTLEPEEDELVVDYLLNKHPDLSLEPITLNIIKSEPIMEWDGKKFHESIKENVLRIYPNDNDSEGFFVAKFKKAK